MAANIDIRRDEELDLWRCDFNVEIPPISVTRYKNDRSDFKYELQRAVTEIVEEYVTNRLEDEF